MIATLFAGLGFVLLPHPASAQLELIEDTSPGRALGTTVIPSANPLVELVTGGTRPNNGINLFHSFEEFNIQQERGVYFFNPDGVENILTRVTGTDPSDILGTLGLFDSFGNRGTANFYLINPNGILFGPNAALDVGGSFMATTANHIQLGENGLFSASNPSADNLLTVNPSAVAFTTHQSQPIVNQATLGISFLDFQPILSLTVSPSERLQLIGGDVRVENGGQLLTLGGHIDIASVRGEGIVRLTPDGSLRIEDNAQRGNVDLSNATVGVSGNSGGNVSITAHNIEMHDSALQAGILLGFDSETARAGQVRLNASGKIHLYRSFISNNIETNAIGSGGDIIIDTRSLSVTNNSDIQVITRGTGNAGRIIIRARDYVFLNNLGRISSGVDPLGEGKGGNIEISTGMLRLANRASLSSNIFGRGTAGNVVIRARNNIVLDDRSSISSDVSAFGQGNGGNINITTGSLALTNESFLTSSLGISGRGNAGNVLIRARDHVSFNNASRAASGLEFLGQGRGGNVEITAESLAITNGSSLSSSIGGQGIAGDVIIRVRADVSLDNTSHILSSVGQNGQGDGGNIEIFTGSLALSNGAFLSSSTFGRGNAGDLVIRARNHISFDSFSSASSTVDVGGRGQGGSIGINASTLALSNGSFFSTSTFDQGNAGNVLILARDNFLLSNRSGIFAESDSTEGIAGNIVIDAALIDVQNSSIRAFARLTSGGNIRINTNGDLSNRTIFLQNGDISTESRGNGGNIAALGAGVIALDDTDIIARSRDANGGNIVLGPFFSDTIPIDTDEPFDGDNQVDVNASGRLASGSVTIPDTSFIQNSLASLSQVPIDTNALLANSCIVQRNRPSDSSFLITGSGGLPNRPGNIDIPFRIGVVRSLPTDIVGSEAEQHTYSWQLGDPIVEPQGVYLLPTGQLIMSRECPLPS